MKDKTKKHTDESVSAKACGCDPRENHLCNLHDGSKQCVVGHWIRRDNCPACKVLMEEKENV